MAKEPSKLDLIKALQKSIDLDIKNYEFYFKRVVQDIKTLLELKDETG